MDIHPYTHHDIARLRGEERLVRALAAQRAREVVEQQRARWLQKAFHAVISLLQRGGRRQSRTAADARSNAM